jgi:hypothetical protein
MNKPQRISVDLTWEAGIVGLCLIFASILLCDTVDKVVEAIDHHADQCAPVAGPAKAGP